LQLHIYRKIILTNILIWARFGRKFKLLLCK